MVFYGEFSVDSSIVSIYFGIFLLLLPTCGSTYASSLGFLLNMFWILNMTLFSLFEYFGSRCLGETWVVIFHSISNTHCFIPITWWATRIISHSYMFVCVTTPTGFWVGKGFWIFKSVINYASTFVTLKLGSSYFNNHLCICLVVNLMARPSYATSSSTRGVVVDCMGNITMLVSPIIDLQEVEAIEPPLALSMMQLKLFKLVLQNRFVK